MGQKVDFKTRVIQAAEAALARDQYVSPISLLTGMGLLAESNVDVWKKGRLPFLEEMIQGSEDKLAKTFVIFAEWAKDKGLRPTEVNYLRHTRAGATALQITRSGDEFVEKLFRTHFFSPVLPEKKQQQLVDKQSRATDPVVFQIVKDSTCSECGTELLKGDMLYMEANLPLCLECAHFGNLEYLAAGDVALTRRASKYSARKAVVVRFSRSRGHYERQGILVEPAALERAEQECLEDADERAEARAAGVVKRQKDDAKLVKEMMARIAELFPKCPPKEVAEIALHTAARGSGRVGRTAAGKALDEGALTAAVTAAVRHNHTKYDDLLARGVDRTSAREQVFEKVQGILAAWRADR